VDRLLAADIVAPAQGHLPRAFASPGQKRSAGGTVVGIVECGRAFVVGIFSIRQANYLSLGTCVTNSVDGWRVTRTGTVVQVVQRATDCTDLGYAMPFTPLERREMYVLVQLETPVPARLLRSVQAGQGCLGLCLLCGHGLHRPARPAGPPGRPPREDIGFT